MPPLAYGEKDPPFTPAAPEKGSEAVVTLRVLQRAQINESDRNRSPLPPPHAR